MDAESVELLGHHRSVCAQLPFRSTGGSPGARGCTESCYRSNGGSGYPHHSVGSASRLPACFSSCRTTFARKVSWVPEKNSSRKLADQARSPTPRCHRAHQGQRVAAKYYLFLVYTHSL